MWTAVCASRAGSLLSVGSAALVAAAEQMWVHQDSNLEPIGYEPTALTIELWTLILAFST